MIPPALIPPPRRAGSSATAAESLTSATLSALDSGTPAHLTPAADIAAHRWHFHRIPGIIG